MPCGHWSISLLKLLLDTCEYKKQINKNKQQLKEQYCLEILSDALIGPVTLKEIQNQNQK